MIFQILGLLSAAVFIAGDIPYVIDALKGRIKPQRVTWGIAVVLNIIAIANQFASGATNSLLVFIAGMILTLIIFIASLKNGVGGKSRQDIAAVIISAVGLLLWAVFDSPLFSIIANIFVAGVALWPTYRKARKHPESETRITWLCSSISGFLAAVSVGAWDWQLIILPLSFGLQQLYLVYLLYIRPMRTR